MDFLGSLVRRERCAFVSGWWAARCRPCSTAHNKQIKLILKKMLGLKYPNQHTKYVLASKSTFSSSHLTSSVFSSVITSICPVFNVDQVLYARGRGGHVLRKPRGQVKRLPWTSKVWISIQSERLQGNKQTAGKETESSGQVDLFSVSPWSNYFTIPSHSFSHLCYRSGSCSYQLPWGGKELFTK